MVSGWKSPRERCVHTPLLLRLDICSQLWLRHVSLGWLFVLHLHLGEEVTWMEDGEAQCSYQDHTKVGVSMENPENDDIKATHTHSPTRCIQLLSA